LSAPLSTSEVPLLRAVAVRSRGGFDADGASDVITLDHHSRRRRRCLLTTDSGRELMLDLEHVARIVDGDALELDGGGRVTVRAAPEDLLEIRVADQSRLIRIAWHLGNRHTPAEITSEAIYIAADHVLEEMLVGLGAQVRRVRRPFEPESGAYAGHTHGSRP
jgi:urease accessory protein